MNCTVFNSQVNDSIDIFKYNECAILTQIGENFHTFYLSKGIYLFELWGASGGFSPHQGNSKSPGKGAYVSGQIKLSKTTTFFGFIGTKGCNNTPNSGSGGFNGGGNGGYDNYNRDCGGGGGGGATDIRYNAMDLYSRIIVSGGGGSPGCYQAGGKGGNGGKIFGQDGDKNDNTLVNEGKGANFDNETLFGKGQDGFQGNEAGGAGGGGYFGGYGGYGSTKGYYGGGGGGGGSSYISGYPNCITYNTNGEKGGRLHFSGYRFYKGVMIPGNETMPMPDSALIGYECHSTHGCIRIRRIWLTTRCLCHKKSFQVNIFLMISTICS